jgi:sec-independent protein translocase protein TatA
MPFVDNILQPTHLLLILVVALLVLGPKRLPEAGRALGQGIRDFRSAMTSHEQEPHEQLVSQATNVEATQPQPQPQAKEPAPPAEPFQPVG